MKYVNNFLDKILTDSASAATGVKTRIPVTGTSILLMAVVILLLCLLFEGGEKGSNAGKLPPNYRIVEKSKNESKSQ